MTSVHRVLQASLLFACVTPAAKTLRAQTPAPPAVSSSAPETKPAEPSEPLKDRILFKDGDQISGQVLRAEHGSVVFVSSKTGQDYIPFSEIKDLIALKKFAIIKNGLKVTRSHAIIGKIELKDDKLIVKPEDGKPITLEDKDIALAVDDETFEREVLHKYKWSEGWSGNVGIGGSLVRASQDSTSLDGNFQLQRELPGVDYLPRRSRSTISANDNYNKTSTPDTYGGGAPFENETHIFHASAEHNEYISSRIFWLANYTFDRDSAQGLLAQNLYGGGIGWTALDGFEQKLNLKSDLHVTHQNFDDAYDDDDNLFGQKFTIEYQRSLPRGLRFEMTSDYLAAYNQPHRYSANTRDTLTIPLFWQIGLTLGIEDNYLNVPTYDIGGKPNTFRATFNLTYYKSAR